MAVPRAPKKAIILVMYTLMSTKNPAIGKTNKQPIISPHTPYCTGENRLAPLEEFHTGLCGYAQLIFPPP